MTDQTTALALLRDAENYLSALHGSVARHDHLAANLGCAGCDLRDRIAAELHVAMAARGLLADETAAAETRAAFTEARAAFMQIGRTPSLEGLRAELRIEGQEPIIGRYCGASMGRMHDVPGHEHLLAVDPRLIFEYAEEQPAAGARQDGAQP